MISWILIIIGLLTALAAVIGCILPIIPGPLVGYLALLILSLALGWEPFSVSFLLIMAAVALLVTFLDYIVSLVGARQFGASGLGLLGAVFGMTAGVFLFPPWGLFFGAIAGAVAGELVAGKNTRTAFRAGWGVLIGAVAGVALKLAYCFSVLFFYIKALF